MSNKKTVLFICGGNTCRSPLAEVTENKKLCELSLNDRFTADSAGVTAQAGDRASKGSQTAAKKLGLDLSEHRAKHLDGFLIKNAFKIVPMTLGLYEMLSSVQGIGDKLIKPPFDIPDPFMQSDEVYFYTAQKILELCDYVTEVITS